MNKQINLKNIINHYTDSFSDYGDTPKGANWKDEKSQLHRFDILLNGIGVDNINNSVTADLGCGTGAFLSYLASKDITLKQYIGYDIVQDVLEFSESKFQGYKINNQWIQSANPNRKSDYIVSSGIFNVKLNYDEEAWLNYIFNVIKEMQHYATKGYAFNLLRDNVSWKSPELYYANPITFKKYCQSVGKNKVKLIENYGLYEWTIIVEKQ